LLVWGERLPNGQGFRVHFEPFPEPLSGDLDTAVGQINRAMESLIRQCPQQYLWGYGRYKQPRGTP
jgi:KDO2-lipid IV(A) lauroyltransferase